MVATRVRAGLRGPAAAALSAATDAALTRFAACMRANAITSFPAPAHGAFNVIQAHINQTTPQYKTAQARCNPILQAPASHG